MLTNYIRFFFRLLRRNSIYYLINVGGLAVGITGFLVVLIYCSFELSFDDFHQNKERIVRVVGKSARTPIPLAAAMITETSGIETASRVIYSHSGLVLIDSAGNAHEEKGFSVDSTFFDVFSFPFLYGTSSALDHPKNIVVTERFALKVFGKRDVVGTFMKIDGMPAADADYRISAVIETPPINSQFDFDILTRYSPHSNLDNWGNNLVYTYALMKKGANKMEVESNIRDLFRKKTQRNEDDINVIELQSLADQHFDSSRSFDFGPHTSSAGVYMLMCVAVLILSIACINFVNLSTARAADRRKEVGMKKINGATRQQLIFQFLFESLLVSLFGFLAACALFYFIIPVAQTLTGLDLINALNLMEWPMLSFLIALPVAIGLLSGIYPALLVSSFDSVHQLKDNTGIFKTTTIRKILVGIQFGITAFLFIGTLTILHQFNFINAKDLGFDDDQVVVLNIGFPGLGDRIEAIRNDLEKNPDILSVSAALTVPGDLTYTMPYSIYDTLADVEHRLSWAGLYVDPEFVTNMDIRIKQGRSFSTGKSSDTLNFLLNETAVAFMINKYGDQWLDPVGKTLNYFRSDNTGYHLAKKGMVIGVVNDFNYYSLHQKVDPLAIQVDYRLFFKLLVKVNPSNIASTLQYLEATWKQHGITKPFNYVFLDKHFGMAYEKEEKFKQIFFAFSVLSILISACGLYGLVLFAAEKRIREMSIRKVLGANAVSIIVLFIKEFITPVILSFIIVGPFAWWAMSRWLEQFAYRVPLEFRIFLVAAMITFSLAFITILFRTMGIVRSNPCKSLKQN
ncbi:MAG TPA: FtsX-like permease family protein [Chryseosolibacter sp.]|nr:FtsX-like permease family protein [Chryseosolibacter sp.]